MREDFERMYVEHRDQVFAFLVYRTGDRALAEDLLGDVFERAFRARDRFDPRRGSQMAWLSTIAVNRLRDHHRREQVERAALERVIAVDVVSADSVGDTVADRDRVMNALQGLNERDREIVALRFGADLTAPQIAQVTGQPLTTVEGRLFRALRRLRTLLEPETTATANTVVTSSEGSTPLPSRVRRAPTTARQALRRLA